MRETYIAILRGHTRVNSSREDAKRGTPSPPQFPDQTRDRRSARAVPRDVGLSVLGRAVNPTLWWRYRRTSGGYVIDFWGPGYEIAERMGLIPELRKRGYLANRVLMVDERGRRVANLNITRMREQLGQRFISLPRGSLGSALFDACAGIESHFGISVEGLYARQCNTRCVHLAIETAPR